MGSLVGWTQLRKEPLSLRIYQYKLPKLKGKERQKIEKKNWIECPGTLEQLQKYNIFQVFEIPEEKKEKKEQKKYLKK